MKKELQKYNIRDQYGSLNEGSARCQKYFFFLLKPNANQIQSVQSNSTELLKQEAPEREIPGAETGISRLTKTYWYYGGKLQEKEEVIKIKTGTHTYIQENFVTS